MKNEQMSLKLVIKTQVLIEVENLKHLLLTRDPQQWVITPEFTKELILMCERLLERYVHRAALFGKHRCTPSGGTTRGTGGGDGDSKKRTRTSSSVNMTVRVSDFDLAWQTLEQDSR